MDYFEFMQSNSKGNIGEILECFESIIEQLQSISRFRYEILIKLLIDKRIIDSEEEIIKLTGYNHNSASEIVRRTLPRYSDIGDESGMLALHEEIIEESIKDINTILESELDSMLNRFTELEKRTSFSEQKKNDN